MLSCFELGTGQSINGNTDDLLILLYQFLSSFLPSLWGSLKGKIDFRHTPLFRSESWAPLSDLPLPKSIHILWLLWSILVTTWPTAPAMTQALFWNRAGACNGRQWSSQVWVTTMPQPSGPSVPMCLHIFTPISPYLAQGYLKASSLIDPPQFPHHLLHTLPPIANLVVPYQGKIKSHLFSKTYPDDPIQHNDSIHWASPTFLYLQDVISSSMLSLWHSTAVFMHTWHFDVDILIWLKIYFDLISTKQL